MNNQLCQTSLALTTYALWGLTMSQPVTGAPLYSVTEIGNFSNYDFTNVKAINNKGEIVIDAGVASGNGGFSQAFLYNNGKLQDLGSLSGSFNVPNGINDKSQVVGSSSDYNYIDNSFSGRAFLYSNGKLQDLGSLGGRYNEATAINNNGQIVGYSGTGPAGNGHSARAFLYSGGKLKDIGSLGGPLNVATAINNNGQIVGYSGTVNQNSARAFLYSSGKLQDLGSLGGPSNVATAINNKGQVIGYSGDGILGSYSRAFLCSGGKLQDLGSLGGGLSFAFSINDKGQVVGDSNTNSQNQHAFLYSNGKLQDLNSLISPKSGVTLINATSINDDGQIAATGSINNDAPNHAFLLTPSPLPRSRALSQKESEMLR